jgi:hypothetical protein
VRNLHALQKGFEIAVYQIPIRFTKPLAYTEPIGPYGRTFHFTEPFFFLENGMTYLCSFLSFHLEDLLISLWFVCKWFLLC